MGTLALDVMPAVETQATLTALDKAKHWNGFDEASRAEMKGVAGLVETMLDANLPPEQWVLLLDHHRFQARLHDCPMIRDLSERVREAAKVDTLFPHSTQSTDEGV